jgi:hypothetical protein
MFWRRVLPPCSVKESKQSRQAANKNELQDYNYASPKRLQTSTGLHGVTTQKFTRHSHGHEYFKFYIDYWCLTKRGAPSGRWIHLE